MDNSVTSLIIVTLILLTGILFKKKEINWTRSEKVFLGGAMVLLAIATLLNLKY